MAHMLYTHEEMHSVGIGPGSPDSWDDYPQINSAFRDSVKGLYSPAAYKALHFDRFTFKRLFELPGTPSDRVKIFKMEGGCFVPRISEGDRSPYLPIIEAARRTMKANHRNILQALINGQTENVSVFLNMGFACESSIFWTADQNSAAGPPATPYRSILQGYFPYFSNLSAKLGEFMVFFTLAETDRIALATAPSSERRAVIEFLRRNGVMQFFDKVCARCGKTGDDLWKCPCKALRFCSWECHELHWPIHREDCEWRSARNGSSP
jgi:hypothetical protein